MHVFDGQFNTKMTIGIEQYLLMKRAINYFEILFEDGHLIQVLKLNEFQKINRRLWYGEELVLKVLSPCDENRLGLDD